MLAARLALIAFLASAPLAAQDYIPDFRRLESLVARVEAGDAGATRQLEREGRGFFTWATQRRVTGATAHLVARVGLVAGAPFAHPDSAISQREVFWRSGLVRALHSALAADSGDLVAAGMLEQLEPYPHVWMQPDKQLTHLRAMVARHTELPIPLALSYVGLELECGDPERARAMLLLLDRDAVGQVRWKHLDAQAQFARKQPSGADRYFEGARDIANAADAQVYREDLEWIAEPEELAAFDALEPGDSNHTKWLRKFWIRRDLEDARLPGTRLREHFERWRLALREYRWDREGSHARGVSSTNRWARSRTMGDILFPMPRFNVQSESVYYNRLRSLSRVLDDRGAMVMRHGVPAREGVQHGITGLDQATLLWATPSGPLIVGFSLPEAGELGFGMVARNIPMGDLMAQCVLDSRLCALAALATVPSAERDHAIELSRGRYQAMREVAESTDNNVERFTRPLEAFVQSYGIAGGGILVSYAVRARDLDGGVARVRIVVGSVAEGEIVGTVDTERRWALPADADAFVTGWTVVDAPPGNWHVGVVLSDMNRERGSGAASNEVPVISATAAAGLRLSDPILGRENSDLRWMRLGRSIPLNPTGAWLQHEEGVLSTEIHGMVPQREYRVAIELLEGEGDDARSRLVITETLVPTSATHFLQRHLSFANLERGDYRLRVRVRDVVSGTAVERERAVPVR